MSRLSGTFRDSPYRLPRLDIAELNAPGLAVPPQERNTLTIQVQEALAASLGAASEIGQLYAQQQRLAYAQQQQAEVEKRRQEAASEEARRTADRAEAGSGVNLARTLLPQAVAQIRQGQIAAVEGETPTEFVDRIVGTLVPEDASQPFRDAFAEQAAPALASALQNRVDTLAEQGRDTARLRIVDEISTLKSADEINAAFADAGSLFTPEQRRASLSQILSARASLGDADGVEAVATAFGDEAPIAVASARLKVSQIVEQQALQNIQEQIDKAGYITDPSVLSDEVDRLRAMPGLRLEEQGAIDRLVRQSQDAVREDLTLRFLDAPDVALEAARRAASLPSDHPGHLSASAYGAFLNAVQGSETARIKQVQHDRLIEQTRAAILNGSPEWAYARMNMSSDDRTEAVNAAMQEVVDQEQTILANTRDINPEGVSQAEAEMPQRILSRQMGLLERSGETYQPFTASVLNGLSQARAAAISGNPVPQESVAALRLFQQMPPGVQQRSFNESDLTMMRLADVASRHNFAGDPAQAMRVIAGFTPGRIDRTAIAGASKAFDESLAEFRGTADEYAIRRTAEDVAAIMVMSGAVGSADAAAREAGKLLSEQYVVRNGRAIETTGIPVQLIGNTETSGIAEVEKLLIDRLPESDEYDKRNLTLRQLDRGWVLWDRASGLPVGNVLPDDQVVGVLQAQRDAENMAEAQTLERRIAARASRREELIPQIEQLQRQLDEAYVQYAGGPTVFDIAEARFKIIGLRGKIAELEHQLDVLPRDPNLPTEVQGPGPLGGEGYGGGI